MMNIEEYEQFISLVSEMRKAQIELIQMPKDNYEAYLDQENETECLESKVDKFLRNHV